MMMRWLFLVLILIGPASAYAGYIELGVSANYRASGYDKDNTVESISYTTSFSYYFWQMCAWELDYTTGYAKTVTKAPGPLEPKEVTQDNIQLASLELILSFAGREAPFRPYVKFGGGYLKKERYFQVNDGNNDLISTQEGPVPTGGLGLSIKLTHELSLNLGGEVWTSPVTDKNDPLIVDYAARAGLSWMF